MVAIFSRVRGRLDERDLLPGHMPLLRSPSPTWCRPSPGPYALVLFLLSKLVNSRAAALTAIAPIRAGAGVEPGCSSPSCRRATAASCCRPTRRSRLHRLRPLRHHPHRQVHHQPQLHPARPHRGGNLLYPGLHPDQHTAVTGPSSNGSHTGPFFISSSRLSGEASLDFQKKYSESLNPYAMRFITLILLFTPSSTLIVHRVVCTRQDPHIYFDKFRPNRFAAALPAFLHLPHPAPPSSPSFHTLGAYQMPFSAPLSARTPSPAVDSPPTAPATSHPVFTQLRPIA